MSFNSDIDNPPEPDAKPAKGKTATRRKARSLAMQALYQWHMAGQSINEIEAQFRVDNDFAGVDGAYFCELLHGVPSLKSELDELLVYRKRLRRQLGDYQRNVPPHVRAARLADDYNDLQGRPRQYQSGGWISYVITVSGPEPLEARRALIDYDHYLTRQLQPVADAILPFVDDDFSKLIDRQLGLF